MDSGDEKHPAKRFSELGSDHRSRRHHDQLQLANDQQRPQGDDNHTQHVRRIRKGSARGPSSEIQSSADDRAAAPPGAGNQTPGGASHRVELMEGRGCMHPMAEPAGGWLSPVRELRQHHGGHTGAAAGVRVGPGQQQPPLPVGG